MIRKEEAKNSRMVYVVIQEKVIHHDPSSGAPFYSKEIVGIYFNKIAAVQKRTDIILNTRMEEKYSYVFIEPHNVR